ncbi:MAG: hypothetical protein QOF76_1486 [Solirubrobacteraceae bacterium]|nr:hypothetical protein [Solirubrobacteraceae bacterium]
MRSPVPALVCLALAGCGGADKSTAPPKAPAAITITSTAFADGGTIPTQYTCAGEGTPPPLAWTGVPDDAHELVLFVEDPDAPGEPFVHWIRTEIPTDATALPDGDDGWKPPCPPEGDPPHHYRFNLYALGRTAALTPDMSDADARREIERAEPMARGLLVGRFGR